MRYKIYISTIIIGLLFYSCNRIKNKANQIVHESKTVVNETKSKIESELNPTTIQLFEKSTGLIVTDSIWENTETDTYFLHEGEQSIIFETTDSQIQEWIDNKPPWDNIGWKQGEIPDYVFNCKFGFKDGVSKYVYSYEDGSSRIEYSGDSILIKLMQNENIFWASKEYCCPDKNLRYHNGSLLIIEKDKNKIWHSIWDY